MTKENMARIHRTYNILFSIVLVITGICFIAGVLCIYFSGDQPFSRESVAATFAKIAFPVYLCIVMTIVNIVWGFISPTDEKKKPISKKKITSNKEETPVEDKKAITSRNVILVVAVALILVGLVNGGTIAVLAKAINICTECIGLG